MTSTPQLSTSDRFELFEQINLHQRCIDNDASRESAAKYVELYWPEASFTVKDIRQNVFQGLDGMKQLYDYAHSVFPMHRMRHALGTFAIEAQAEDKASVEWNWIVSWKDGNEGVLSTGTYSDVFQKRDGIWKCL
ncbi:MAG: hypothetical protein JWQ72_1217, partial [Polaromonas sp.]|nr:hypothetical protein [Polaromonas sp.]